MVDLPKIQDTDDQPLNRKALYIEVNNDMIFG